MEQKGTVITGQIQIVKTVGLSQYLYTLAVTDISTEQWQAVNKLIYKFLWKKTYNNNSAPTESKTILCTQAYIKVDLEW
jgi:hypothetical protein